jgi:GNAT superfamily N-acetyltransferase
MIPPATPVTGIVFRRLVTPSERNLASGLLADGAIPSRLFGLWDLAAPDGEELVGVATARPADAGGSVELCGIAIRAGRRRRGLGRRLVAEVADALRSEGAGRLVARLEDGQGPAAALLARAGFAAMPAGGRDLDGAEVRWFYLEL